MLEQNITQSIQDTGNHQNYSLQARHPPDPRVINLIGRSRIKSAGAASPIRGETLNTAPTLRTPSLPPCP